MARPKCRHALPVLPGQSGRNPSRPCALGRFGGTVRRLVECEACPDHESAATHPTAPPAAKQDKKQAADLPCVWEGPVVEACHSCRGEARSVRLCLHPNPSDPDRDACTREYVGPAAQACRACPDRVELEPNDG